MLQSTDKNKNTKCNTYKYLILRVLESKVMGLIEKVDKPENGGGFTAIEKQYQNYKKFELLLKQIQEIPRIALIVRFGGGIKKRKTAANKQIIRYSKTSKNRFNSNFTQKYSGGGITTWVKGKFGEQQYREMLREYVISTGNMSLILGEYLIHYNEYNRLFPETHEHNIRNVMREYEKLLTTNLQSTHPNVPVDEINEVVGGRINNGEVSSQLANGISDFENNGDGDQ